MPIVPSLTGNEIKPRDSLWCAANHRGFVKLRLFVAIEIDAVVRALAQNAATALAASGVAGRFESPEKMHVTVAFLGNAPESNLAAITQALRDTASGCTEFEIDFGRLGAFPNERRPRVIWIGPVRESAAFASCAGRVREVYKGLGFAFDHDAAAHITICRPKFVPSGGLPELAGNATLSVTGLTLFQSLPAGPTTRYEALERIAFPRRSS
jgi:RNA 2',3'-cyclic 3'-phosphodiesterase